MLKAVNKGVVLFVVLMTVILVIILGNIILGLMFSQNRFTQHKVGRIQAYYAGLAGVRYAEEMLRTNSWSLPSDTGSPLGTGTNFTCGLLCRSTTCSSNECPAPDVSIPIDESLPGSIQSIAIFVGESHSQDQTGYGTRKVTASVDYTLQ
jgi:Tfp pilus assembly protein PilX